MANPAQGLATVRQVDVAGAQEASVEVAVVVVTIALVEGLGLVEVGLAILDSKPGFGLVVSVP